MFNIFLSTLSKHDLAVVKVALSIMKEDLSCNYFGTDNFLEENYYRIAEDFLATIVNIELPKLIPTEWTKDLQKEVNLLYNTAFDAIDIGSITHD
ncbi:hypothetical protein [Streptococcus suis]|uniref:hypothetical protein n=2 Tax=Streptococcus suis TaxID=1307 RepID=UPI000CF4C7FC|nr:hypothetical protein [Streptococcus suis]MBL6504531.1 hypothetical protein [Streptococcus suis]MBM7180024.1 hypothetical protein [Streptococcus suis]MBM7205138.1 hypothetical protein [Streptococcus suis]MBM7283004.1 hypothetical protein [Streptococcus suis]MBO4125432.1 hypothetical protein [Streptococcus suis]